jgi:AcrR family transcriptional regulator
MTEAAHPDTAARARTGRSTERGSATRDRILTAADQVLSERGYAGTSISAICQRAEIAPTSIYWHFGSKAGLLQAVLRQQGSVHFDGIRSAASGGAPLDRLDRMLTAMRELATTRPPGSLTSLSVVAEARHVAPELREALQRNRLKEIDQTVEEFASATGGRHPDLEAAAILTTACANYAALTHTIEGDEDEVDRILEALRRAIVALVGPHLTTDSAP